MLASPPEDWAAAIANISARPTVRLETATGGGSAATVEATGALGDGASTCRWTIAGGSAPGGDGTTIGDNGSARRGYVGASTRPTAPTAARCRGAGGTPGADPEPKGPGGEKPSVRADPAYGGGTGVQAAGAGAVNSAGPGAPTPPPTLAGSSATSDRSKVGLSLGPATSS